jgi:signal transduction histidine kinase
MFAARGREHMRKVVLSIQRILPAFVAAGAAICLGLVGRDNYLLFHVLAEGFCVLVACGIFVVAWNAREQIRGGYLGLLGPAFLCVGFLDLVHALAYQGMGVFPGVGADEATQLWVVARGMESFSLLCAFAFLPRRAGPLPLLGIYAMASALAVLAIFRWRIFPACFVEGSGLTPFKIWSEYAFIAMLGAALALLLRNRARFDRRVLRWLAGALAISMASEFAFTLYASPTGPANLVGHLLLVAAFYFIYKAFIRTGIRHPFDVLFRDLKQSQLHLQEARRELEARVEQRTAELRKTVEVLGRERQKLFTVLNVLPGYVALKDGEYRFRFANHTFLDLFSVPGQRPCYQVQRGADRPCPDCALAEVLRTRQPHTVERTFGKGRTFQVWQYPFADADGSDLVLELGLDLTERKELERMVLRASEVERRRIGADLHDSLGQKLAGLSFLIEGLSRKLGERHPEDVEAASQVNDVIRESISQVRAIAKGLDPVGLSGGGFLAGLAELADRTARSQGVHCRFVCSEDVAVEDETVASHLFHIAREAAEGAVRDRRATRIDIGLEKEGEGVTLWIRDDGESPPVGRPEGDGAGARMMRFRASAIRGVLELQAGSGGGRTLRCHVPNVCPWRGEASQT